MGHLQENGFEVETREVSDAELRRIKSEHGVPGQLEGCHTGVIDGFVVEGHVPADAVKRLHADTICTAWNTSWCGT